jgi:hypothetical protein
MIDYAGHAVGQLVFRPNSTKHLSRLFVWMGVRDPREAMNRSNTLMNWESAYFFLMFTTGMIAMTFAAASAGAVRDGVMGNDPDSFSPWVWFTLMVINLTWLWGLKVLHGWILWFATHDLPNARRLYDYRWYWPLTLRSSLRMTYLIKNWRLNRTTSEKLIGFGGTLFYCALVKVPLYISIGGVVLFMAQTGQFLLS